MRQRGYTLVEMLVVIAVGGLIMPVALALIHQVVWGTGRTNSQMTSLVDVNQAALVLKRDLLMSQTTNLSSTPLILTPQTPGLSVQLSWTDYTSFVTPHPTHNSTYALSGTKLRRTHDGMVSTIGQYITSLSIAQNDRVINVIITSTSPQVPHQIETLRFRVYQRRDPIE